MRSCEGLAYVSRGHKNAVRSANKGICGPHGWGKTQKLPEAEDQPPEPQSELLELEPQSEPPPEAKDQPDPDELEPLWKGSKSSWWWCEPEFENSVDHRRKSPSEEPV